MNVLINAMNILDRGGCGLYTRELIRGVLEADGIRASLSIPESKFRSIGQVKDIRINEDIIAHTVIPKETKLSLFPESFWHYLTLPAWERRQEFDIFHDPAQIGGFTLRSPSKKILTVHDLSPLTHPDVHPKERVLKHKYLLPQIISNTDLVVVPSNATGRDVAEILGTDENRIMTIHLGCDHLKDERKADFSMLKKKMGMDSPNPFILLTVSTLEPRKNIEVIVDAFEMLCTLDVEKDDFYLVIVGDWGWKNEELEKRIARSPFLKNIVITGRIKDDALVTLYEKSSVFACMSIKEGFGLPPLEAQFFGLPTVISSDEALMEVSGRGALLVKSDDNKKKMAEDLLNNIMNIRTKPELRKEMIDKGKRNAAKYTWRKFTQNIIQAYDSVL